MPPAEASEADGSPPASPLPLVPRPPHSTAVSLFFAFLLAAAWRQAAF